MSGDKVLKLTESNFETEVLNSNKPVLVDFWASWCGYCIMIEPIMNELANELDGKVKIGKINVDEESQLAIRYDVMTIPAVFLFKNGKLVQQSVGAKTKAELIDMINQNI